MAHFGEAQAFIHSWNMKRVSSELFLGDQSVILLTGEGPFEATTQTALTLSRYPIKEIVNLGIAGALDEKLKKGDFVKIRTIYLAQEGRPYFKSFPLSPEGKDCITCFERIITLKKAEPLRGLGHLVDREAWGVAMAAKSAQIPFQCYKIVSDLAGSLESCELTKESAEDLSQDLFLKFSQLQNLKKQNPTIELPEKFHFTFTTQQKLLNLIKKLAILNGLTDKEVLNHPKVFAIQKTLISGKEKTQLLLDFF